MINNFKLIRPLLNFTNEGDFYFLQIIKRRKDNPEIKGDSIIIDNYYIYSLDTFDKIESKVIDQCEKNNARAYIRLNKRNAEKVAMIALKKTVDYIMSKDYKAVKTAYTSACGDSHSDDNKTWIVDIDVKDPLFNISVSNIINHVMPAGDKIVVEIPTRSGVHLITKPFNVHEFNKICTANGIIELSIHKDNPSVLYVN
jgi:hypothetical protein